MAEFLIQALNETAPLRYWRGDIIQDYDDGTCTQPPAPGRVILKVPGLERTEARTQIQEWWRRIAYSVVSQDLTTDAFRLKIEATEFNPTSGIGKVVQGMTNSYLSNWNATNLAFTDNAVAFDIKILDAIKSQGFWRGTSITGMTLVEITYTQATGNHRCRVNYSATSYTESELINAITENSGVIVSTNPTAKTITFDITRAGVRSKFEEDVKQRTEQMIVRRKYKFSEAAVAAMEANGRWLTVSLADYNTYFKNKLAE